MNIIFMGTPEFAIPSLQTLIQENYNILAVFTQPDRPRGRSKKLVMPPVKEKALEHNIKVYQPKTLKDSEVVETIKELNPDLIIVVAYGQILTKEVLDIPKHGCINVHASLLPKYRGAGPIQWAIINGEKTTGITTMYMDVGLDTGDMILKEEINIGENETAVELHYRLSVLGGEVLKKTLDNLKSGEITRTKQDDSKSTYAPMLTKDLGIIDWTKSAREIHNLIRGTIPWPVASTKYKGETMRIFKSRVEEDIKENVPGEIIKVTNDRIYVGTSKDILIIDEIQFSGGKRLNVKDYLVGNTIEQGIILGK
ncbi:MAG: methionyl-tRNA formyltransferase [Clostridiales bacterium]|nr:methionyl-tRNA formyltransferase [Clostridiales bacterium]